MNSKARPRTHRRSRDHLSLVFQRSLRSKALQNEKRFLTPATAPETGCKEASFCVMRLRALLVGSVLGSRQIRLATARRGGKVMARKSDARDVFPPKTTRLATGERHAPSEKLVTSLSKWITNIECIAFFGVLPLENRYSSKTLCFLLWSSQNMPRASNCIAQPADAFVEALSVTVLATGLRQA
jgi:hypothetical protein